MKRLLSLLSLAVLCAVVTGCPSNNYIVELMPQADGTIERTLTFFCADDSGTNGVLTYDTFPSNELFSITSLYPAGAVKTNGLRYIAKGSFAGSMPADVGGVGSYTNFATSLGDAGFYMERFRGSNDLAGRVTRRLQAADQIDDLIIGWSKTQFGHERGYKKLHKFLDEDFRQDLKNAGLYAWAGEVNNLSETNNLNEFMIRYSQYLYERGYLKPSDTRDIYLLVEDEADTSVVRNLARRLLMEKMGLPAAGPAPKSFAVLDDPEVLEKSWEKYLAGTELYRHQVAEARKTNPKTSGLQPSHATDDLVSTLFFGDSGAGFLGSPDQLIVRLVLTNAPDFTNGKWQDGKVVWTADLDPNRPLPVVCYAGWSNPNTQFQTEHFGHVILDGPALSKYCYWQGSLGAEQAREWEALLGNLKPGSGLKTDLETFHFAGEAAPETINEKPNHAYIGRKLLLGALGNGK